MRLNLTQLPANNLRRISTMYVRGYLQGSENGRVVTIAMKAAFSIQSCRSCYATQHLCQRSFYQILVKFRNSNKNVLKIVLIIVNINEDENKPLISNQFSLKNDPPPPHFLENYFAEVKI